MNFNDSEVQSNTKDLNNNKDCDNSIKDVKEYRDLTVLFPLKQFLFFDILNPQEATQTEIQNHARIPAISIKDYFHNLKLELINKLNNKLQTSTFLTSTQAKMEILEELQTHKLYLMKLYELFVSLKYNYSSNIIVENQFMVADEIAYLYNESKKFIVTKADLFKIGFINNSIQGVCGFEDGCREFYDSISYPNHLSKENIVLSSQFLNNNEKLLYPMHSNNNINTLIPSIKNNKIIYFEPEKQKPTFDATAFFNKTKLSKLRINYTTEYINLSIKEHLINDIIKNRPSLSNQFKLKNFLFTEIVKKFKIAQTKISYTNFTTIILGLEFGINFYQWIVLSVNGLSCKKYLSDIFQIVDFDKSLRNEWVLNLLYDEVFDKVCKKKLKYFQLQGSKKDFIIKIFDNYIAVFNSKVIEEFIESPVMMEVINGMGVDLNEEFLKSLFLYPQGINKLAGSGDDLEQKSGALEKIELLINTLKRHKIKYIPIIYFLELEISEKYKASFTFNSGFNFNPTYAKCINYDITNLHEFQDCLKNMKSIHDLFTEIETYIKLEPILSSLNLNIEEMSLKKLKIESNLIKKSEINSKILNSSENNVVLFTEKTYLLIEKNILKFGLFDYKNKKIKTVIQLKIKDSKEGKKNICEISKNENKNNFVLRENYRYLIPYFLIFPLFITFNYEYILINELSINVQYKKFKISINLKEGSYEFLTSDYLKTYEIKVSAHESFSYLFPSLLFDKVVINDISKYLDFLEFLCDYAIFISNKQNLINYKLFNVFKSDEICSMTLLSLKSILPKNNIKENFNLQEFKMHFIETNLVEKPVNPRFEKTLTEFFNEISALKTLFKFLDEKKFLDFEIEGVWFYASPNFIQTNNLVINDLLKGKNFNIFKFMDKHLGFALNHVSPLLYISGDVLYNDDCTLYSDDNQLCIKDKFVFEKRIVENYDDSLKFQRLNYFNIVRGLYGDNVRFDNLFEIIDNKCLITEGVLSNRLSLCLFIIFNFGGNILEYLDIFC
ncbi:hypothetical protein CDIK_0879 [Cucumispora dikerogammari]|nr:hypothetical protein CDIK_0879 [Cucumispora dikerogammari]